MPIGSITALYAQAIIVAQPTAVRFSSDLSTTAEEDRDTLAPGTVGFQIRATYLGIDRKIDSNQKLHTWGVEIVIFHRLQSASNERAWTEAGMATLQQTLSDPDSFWKVSGVHSVSKIDFTEPPKREGNVVSFAIEGFIRTTT